MLEEAVDDEYCSFRWNRSWLEVGVVELNLCPVLKGLVTRTHELSVDRVCVVSGCEFPDEFTVRVFSEFQIQVELEETVDGVHSLVTVRFLHEAGGFRR